MEPDSSGGLGADAEQLFRQMRAAPDPEERQKIREQLVLANTRLVRSLAARFRDRGEPLDDLLQVGMVGLINAVDRFDPDRGNRFATFATPTIVGEIKRYFRDKGWTMRVPRRLQELRLAVNRSIDELSHRLKRSPTIPEIAAEVGAREEDVEMATELDLVYDLVSLDASAPDDERRSYSTQVAAPDTASAEKILERAELDAAIATLPDRQRRIIQMKFFNNMTQAEIAKTLRMSQMHVSRLQHLAIVNLRRRLQEAEREVGAESPVATPREHEQSPS